jgi:hypothetical protein
VPCTPESKCERAYFLAYGISGADFKRLGPETKGLCQNNSIASGTGASPWAYRVVPVAMEVMTTDVD